MSLRRKLLLALQVMVSFSLLAWLFSHEGFHRDFFRVIQSAHLGWILIGLLIAGIVQFFCLVRWRIFLHMVGLNLSWFESAGFFWGGLFWNTFLPGSVGGDFVRIGLLAGRGYDPARAALSVLMDRLAGAISLIVLGAALLGVRYDWLLRSPHVASVTWAIVVYLSGLILLIILSVFFCRRQFVERIPHRWTVRSRLLDLTAVYFQFAAQWRSTLTAIALSVFMLTLYFLTYYCAALAYSAEVPMINFLAIMPAVDIISSLPVSLGGVGVREGVFVLLLGDLCGISATKAVSISLCGYMLSTVWSLPGAVTWFFHGKD